MTTTASGSTAATAVGRTSAGAAHTARAVSPVTARLVRGRTMFDPFRPGARRATVWHGTSRRRGVRRQGPGCGGTPGDRAVATREGVHVREVAGPYGRGRTNRDHRWQAGHLRRHR